MVEIVRHEASGDVRRVNPDDRQIPWYERNFFVEMNDGSSGELWLEVSGSDSFVPIQIERKAAG